MESEDSFLLQKFNILNQFYFSGDESKMAELSERALKTSNSSASVQIAQHILSLVNLSTSKEK